MALGKVLFPFLEIGFSFMKSILSKKLRKLFKEKMAMHLPDFVKIKDPGVPLGHDLYAFHKAEYLTFFVYLQPSLYEDKFTVEIAWSCDNRWPALLVMLSPSDPAPPGKSRFRLSSLWQSDQDYWWSIRRIHRSNTASSTNIPCSPVSKNNSSTHSWDLEEKVQNAMENLIEYGISYLEVIAKKFENNRQGQSQI